MSASAPAAAGKDRQQDDLASRLADAIRVVDIMHDASL